VIGRPRPNTRVQRTRSSPSAHRSPLTRYPLGAMHDIRRPARRLIESPSVTAVRDRGMVRGGRFRLEEGGGIGTECCAPGASAMRADERGRSRRAAAWRLDELGDSTLKESARPPAESAPLWRASGEGESSPKSRASRRNPWSRAVAGPSSEACKPESRGRLTRA